MRPLPALVLIGAAWGATQPLAKIAVEGGHGPLGLIAWQSVIGAALLGALLAARARLPRPTPARLAVWALIVATGSLLPSYASYSAIAHLPAGVMSILISTVAVMAFPLAIAMGTDSFAWPRLAGLFVSLAGVALIAAPGALPGGAALGWVAIALIGPALYAFEGNAVARWGTAGMGPLQTLFGASVLGALMSVPLAAVTGQGRSPFVAWGTPEWALLVMALIHALTYASYVWLVGRAGATFAAQVSYLVTLFGVTWSMLILGESYGPAVWAAMILILGGVALVRPRQDAREQEAA